MVNYAICSTINPDNGVADFSQRNSLKYPIYNVMLAPALGKDRMVAMAEIKPTFKTLNLTQARVKFRL